MWRRITLLGPPVTGLGTDRIFFKTPILERSHTFSVERCFKLKSKNTYPSNSKFKTDSPEISWFFPCFHARALFVIFSKGPKKGRRVPCCFSAPKRFQTTPPLRKAPLFWKEHFSAPLFGKSARNKGSKGLQRPGASGQLPMKDFLEICRKDPRPGWKKGKEACSPLYKNGARN